MAKFKNRFLFPYVMDTTFKKYSGMQKSVRDGAGYIKIKRLVLRIDQNGYLRAVFNFKTESSIIDFALKYFDIELESRQVLKQSLGYTSYYVDFVEGLSDFLCSLYTQDRGFFQTFLGFIFKEAHLLNNHDSDIINVELAALGYSYDNRLLKSTSGEPAIQEKITSVIEDELQKINPELLTIRKGAIEALLSNRPDKARHVSTSCRALINQFLKELVPKVTVSEGESEIYKRIESLFKDSESTKGLIQETTNLIQALNKVQSKGDHAHIDESTAHFVFELTEKVIYFILTSRKQ